MTGRDHGGDADAARSRFGGPAGAWIDLSTGINRRPYPLPPLPASAWRDLPTAAAAADLIAAARTAYGVPEAAACLPLAGAQAAIQLVPRLRPPGRVAILAPTYNEHAAAFAAAGWHVREVISASEAAGADALVCVNPNNPDGRIRDGARLADLTREGTLVLLDESFADAMPEVSAMAACGRPGLVVLRSFGKFFGLAGLRLGFACGAPAEIARLAEAAGPWAVGGPALAVGRAALADRAWQAATRAALVAGAARLDAMAGDAGWRVAGGTPLFRLYETPGAAAAQEMLARRRIWSRIFPYHARWLRLGLPGPEAEWARLSRALAAAARAD